MLSTPNLRKMPSRLSSLRKSKTPSLIGMDFNTFDSGPPSVHVKVIFRKKVFIIYHFQIVNRELKKEVENNAKNEGPNSKPFHFTSVSFDVIRPPMMVPCDEVECRVMISIINLDPHYQHVTVPRLSQFAYLRTISTNTSKYMLLAGPANIYIDSTFIGKVLNNYLTLTFISFSLFRYDLHISY